MQYTEGGATRGHRNIILDQYLILFSRTCLPDDSKQLQDQICIGKFLRIFGQEITGYFLGNSSNLLLDMSRNIGQPVEFYFRGGAWEPSLGAKLIHMRTDNPCTFHMHGPITA